MVKDGEDIASAIRSLQDLAG